MTRNRNAAKARGRSRLSRSIRAPLILQLCCSLGLSVASPGSSAEPLIFDTGPMDGTAQTRIWQVQDDALGRDRRSGRIRIPPSTRYPQLEHYQYLPLNNRTDSVHFGVLWEDADLFPSALPNLSDYIDTQVQAPAAPRPRLATVRVSESSTLALLGLGLAALGVAHWSVRRCAPRG